jgi:hypothetical protein
VVATGPAAGQTAGLQYNAIPLVNMQVRSDATHVNAIVLH